MIGALLVAGCAVSRMPSASFAEPLALEQALKRYYQRHASEEHGYCRSPYIDGLTRVALIEDQPERLVVDVRYFYRDRSKDDGGGDTNRGSECTGFAGRRFALGKAEAGVEVLEMTGERRR